MRAPRSIPIILAALWIALPVHSHGGAPELLPFQNFLVDSDGKPLGSGPSGESSPRNYDVVFRIHPRSSGAEALWSEQQTVTIDRGLFSVQLGEGLPVANEPRPLLSEVFRGLGAGERHLSTTIRFSEQSAEFEILPRIRLLGNPGAILAAATRSIAGSSGSELLSILGDTATVDGNLLLSSPLGAPSLSGNAGSLTGLDASSFTIGTIASEFVPGGLDASLITGTLGADLFPQVLPANKIGDLDATSITSGTLDPARLPEVMLTTSRAGTFTAPVTFMKGLSVRDDLFLGFGALYLGEPGNEDFGLQTRDLPSFGTRVTTLWGRDGGVLGDRRHSDRAALSWDSNNNVTIHRPLIVNSAFSKTTSSPGREYRLIGSRSWWRPPPNWEPLTERVKYKATSIDADGLVVAESFYAFSDRRIKTGVATSDAEADASLVEALNVVDYQMKDRLLRGDGVHRGFIAQEVEDHLPGAVTKGRGFLPDPMLRPASIVRDRESDTLRITTAVPHGLETGWRVRLPTPETILETEVLSSPAPNVFTVRDPGGDTRDLLVHGREVDDLHVLDSDQVFTTAISAIQRLLAESEAMEAEFAGIERELAEIEALESEVRHLTMQLDAANRVIPASHRPATPRTP